MNEFKPMLFTCLKKYNKEQFVKDVVAGIIVAIIALPLSIALALASGVGPEEGLYTAIIAGFLISFLGGSTVQIAGPTAAFATIVAGIVAENGMEGLALATVMAGIILIIMGIFRFGNLIKFIPYTITTGFTAGIAVTILIGQLKDFFGLTYPEGLKPVETMEKVEAVAANFGTVNWYAVLVGVVCLAILIVWPKISKKIPGSLIAVLAGIESLLSCVVADGMTNTKHRSNMELVAQGVGNMGSALFGGIPATGAIARTAANIKNGGKSPVSGMVHSLVLLLILVILMPYAALIPMPTIAAILFTVAYNMCQWRPFVGLVKTAPKSDILVLVLTFVLTVVFDLVVAIEVGMVLACLLFMKRMSEETNVRGWTYREQASDEDIENLRALPNGVRVYEINGPMFFGVAGRIADITTKSYTKCLVLRMSGVPAIDATAMNALEGLQARCAKNNISIVFAHVNEQPMRSMEKAGFVEKIGKDHFCASLEDALELATRLAQ